MSANQILKALTMLRRTRVTRMLPIALLVPTLYLATAPAAQAEDLGVRLENRLIGVSGVQTVVHSTWFGATLSYHAGFQLAKLCNQAGSNRHFMAGLRRQQSGWPDYNLNLYYNLQIRRGTGDPTLLDWYICECQPGVDLDFGVEIRKLLGSNNYTVYFNDGSYGTYSWYSKTSNTCGTWATAELYAGSGGWFEYIKVYEYVTGSLAWRQQTSSRYPNCDLVCTEPYPWYEKYDYWISQPNYEWYCVTTW